MGAGWGGGKAKERGQVRQNREQSPTEGNFGWTARWAWRVV